MGVFIGRKDAEKKRNRSCFRYNKIIFSAEGMNILWITLLLGNRQEEIQHR
jgi:hypothetical protein